MCKRILSNRTNILGFLIITSVVVALVVILIYYANPFHVVELITPTICCPGLPRCYTIDPLHSRLLLPHCPEMMDISTKVYTRWNPNDGQELTRTSIPPVYNGTLMTIYIVHGWSGSENLTWMDEMKDAILQKVDCNVIIFGWSEGAKDPFYFQAAANTRTAGAELALRSNLTITVGGSSREKQYCVGFSLGGAVCGWAGQEGQFGRITGLDHAGPLFDDCGLSCGLNPSCADRVDVIHTNAATATTLGFGTQITRGHTDFYPNGGSEQPGCDKNPPMSSNITDFKTLYRLVSCSHASAHAYYTESVVTPCFLARLNCSDERSIPDSCVPLQQPIQSMGFATNDSTARGLFFLNTNNGPPFCRN